MKNLGKIAVLVLALVVAAVPVCYADATVDDKTVTLSYELGEEAVGKNLTVVVYAPQKSLDSLAEIGDSFKDTLVFSKQVKTDDEGVYTETFKINYEDAVSGMYTVAISGDGIAETDTFLYTNKKKTADAAKLIDENKADAEAVAGILKASAFDLGVDDEYFDEELAEDAAKLICEYIESEKITPDVDNISSIANKAVAIAALSDGKIDNVIAEAELFDLANSPIKDFYEKDYVVDSVGRDMTDRLSGDKIESFADFDDAMTEAFVLAVVKNPDGSDNTKSVLKHFADEIGITENGKNSQYIAVSDKDFDSYEDLKDAFEDAGKTSGGGSSGGGGGGGRGSSASGNVSSITYQETEEKEEHTAYPITIFNDLESVSWAEDAILYLAETQVINGKGEYKFAPEDDVTREEFVKIILNAFKLSPETEKAAAFEDVEAGAWYEQYVKDAYSLGIINGYSETLFGVGEKITREDMAVIIKRAAALADIAFVEPTEVNPFDDDAEISDYAKDSVYTLKNAGVINGLGNGMFGPKQCATRAQAAVMIYNVIAK